MVFTQLIRRRAGTSIKPGLQSLLKKLQGLGFFLAVWALLQVIGGLLIRRRVIKIGHKLLIGQFRRKNAIHRKGYSFFLFPAMSVTAWWQN
jgi:hypothetical protein